MRLRDDRRGGGGKVNGCSSSDLVGDDSTGKLCFCLREIDDRDRLGRTLSTGNGGSGSKNGDTNALSSSGSGAS